MTFDKIDKQRLKNQARVIKDNDKLFKEFFIKYPDGRLEPRNGYQQSVQTANRMIETTDVNSVEILLRITKK